MYWREPQVLSQCLSDKQELLFERSLKRTRENKAMNKHMQQVLAALILVH